MKKYLIVLLTVLIYGSSFINAQSELDPAAAALYNEGNKLRKSGDFNGAIAKYDEALKIADDYRFHYQKGISLKKLRRYDEAEEVFKTCVTINPNFDIGYNGLGSTYFVNGKYLEAVESFKKFGELTPKKNLQQKANEYIARSFAKLGNTSKSDGNYEKAIEYLTEGVKFYDYDAAYLTLAEVYIETAQYEKALEAADKAKNKRKNIPRGGPPYYKGLAFKKMNDTAKAREAFEEGKKDPKYRKLCEYELALLK